MGRFSKGRLFKRGSTYHVQYYDGGHEIKRSLRTSDKREAEKQVKEILAPLLFAGKDEQLLNVQQKITEARLDKLNATGGKKLLIADAWKKYLESHKRPQSRESALADYESRWNHFKDFMVAIKADFAMEDVKDRHVHKFLETLSALSPNRYNKIVQTCRLVYKVLSKSLGFRCDPFEDIAQKRLQTHSHRELSEGELIKVCKTATGEMRTLFAIGLYTALRLGDAATLKWDEISLPLNRIVRVPMKTSRLSKSVYIPLHPTLRAILEETPSESRTGHVTPSLAKIYNNNRSDLSAMVQGHFAKCEITTQKKSKGQLRTTCEVGFHSLRHSFATMCAMSGVPLPVVQALCGHGSPAVQKAYIHVGEDQAKQAINALPDVSTPVEHPKSGKSDERKIKELKAKAIEILERIPPEKLSEAIVRLQELAIPARIVLAEISQPITPPLKVDDNI